MTLHDEIDEAWAEALEEEAEYALTPRGYAYLGARIALQAARRAVKEGFIRGASPDRVLQELLQELER